MRRILEHKYPEMCLRLTCHYRKISRLFQTEIVRYELNESPSLLSAVLEANTKKAEAPGRADAINNVLISFRLAVKGLTAAQNR